MSADHVIDLEGEFAVARRALPGFADRIRPRVSEAIWNAPAPLLGVVAADFDGRGGWAPWAHADHVSGGVLSLIVACRAADGEDDDLAAPVPRWVALEAPDLVDLMAIPLAAPHRWARRTGLARTLGRIPFLEPRSPVRVHRWPASWLRGDGSGIAILDRERGGIAAVLRACTGGIIADDEAHARELHEIAAQPIPMPRIRAVAPAAALREAAE
jgi:hypothetical protein